MKSRSPAHRSRQAWGRKAIPRYVLALLTCSILRYWQCDGAEESLSVPKPNSEGRPKLRRTQGTDQFALIGCGLLDKAGNLWFGTTGEGVYKFDGKSFTQFTAKSGLSDNTVRSIVEDKRGNIWFGTEAGLCRYDGRSISQIPLVQTNFDNLKPASAQNAVTSMLQDRSGKLWIGTGEGVFCYSGTSLTLFLPDDSIFNMGALSLGCLQCMLEDSNGTIWFGSGPMAFEGICRYDGNSITSFAPGGEKWIRHILDDGHGKLWLSTRHQGVWLYDGKTFSRFSEKEGIGSALFIDKGGTIWFGGGENENGFGGDGGIWRYDGKSFTQFTTKDGLGDYSVWCILADKSGNIWVGTRNVGLYRYDGNRFSCFSE